MSQSKYQAKPISVTARQQFSQENILASIPQFLYITSQILKCGQHNFTYAHACYKCYAFTIHT